MTDYPTTETILDADGLDAEAFQRLYTAYVVTDTIFGTVPMSVDDDNGTLTVTVHDPTTNATDGDHDLNIRPNVDAMDVYGVPEYVSGDAPDLSTFGDNGGGSGE